jgi:small subunit ribosomal protein S17
VNNKNLIKGVVTKTSFKIATISIKKKIKHKNYNKYINVSKNHIAHDPTNKCKKGDMVYIKPSRPYSRKKRWIIC